MATIVIDHRVCLINSNGNTLLANIATKCNGCESPTCRFDNSCPDVQKFHSFIAEKFDYFHVLSVHFCKNGGYCPVITAKVTEKSKMTRLPYDILWEYAAKQRVS